jgi:hypothetical protein
MDRPITAPSPPSRLTWQIVGFALLGALITAPLLAVLTPVGFLVLAIAVAVVLAVFVHPPTAAYVLLAVTPFIVGFGRGEVIPVMRPHEALALLVGGALFLRSVPRLLFQKHTGIHINMVDASILFMAITGSVVPLLWMMVRGEGITQGDLLYALQLWKFYGIYLIVRGSVKTEKQVGNCLKIILVVASILAVIGLLQSLNLLGVRDLIWRFYSIGPQGSQGFLATATTGSSFSLADILTSSLAIAAGWFIAYPKDGWILGPASILFLFGIFASAKISGLLGLLVCVGVIGLITGYLWRMLSVLVPAAVVATLSLISVFRARLGDLDPSSGLPESWLVRLDNLRTYFWPELFSDFNWVLGVRPYAVAVGQWPHLGKEVWIESGHTWLLWTGGIPFFIAFWVFLWTSIKAVGRVARHRLDAISAAAVGSLTSLWVMGILMTLDPHLTLRGGADLNFSLLALALCGYGSRNQDRSSPEETTAVRDLEVES